MRSVTYPEKGTNRVLSTIEQRCEEFVSTDLEVGCDLRENRAERAHAEHAMARNGDVALFATSVRGESYVTTGATADGVAVPRQQHREPFAREVAREPQAAMISSLTICRRMTCGRSLSSK